jgi:peroxiredoxin
MKSNKLQLILFCAGLALAADQPGVRTVLSPVNQRKPAPDFAFEDASGKTVSLTKLRGQVVVLDFWATWCHGCKEEIPWFSEFQTKYAAQGLAVVGVSLDERGWKDVKPFLAGHDIPYRIVVGDDPLAKRYAIENMPDTFLIDRKGNVAAVYRGLVDRNDIETNIKTLLKR